MRRTAISISLALAGLCAAPACLAASAAPTAHASTELPRGVVPSHYDILLAPDAASMQFTGKVSITIDVQAATSSITLHAAELTFSRAHISGAKFEADPTISLNSANQTVTLTFAKPLSKGRYQLALDYAGKIGTQPAGLFAVDYGTPDGQRRALYTQFENAEARRMLPSWDEPGYKATFSLSIEAPDADMAVSNMPVEQRSPAGPGKSLLRFARSPKMSTYLLFLGLGDFERIHTSVDGVELGIVTKKGGAAQGQFALDSSKAVLHEYNDYFGQRYPLPKLDNVAAPGRSQYFSAMENWGAIFSFEYSILQDPAISTPADKQRAFTVAAHEIAHQWFGDLVTMAWWDDLWLNEGFASWLESRTTARLHPEWNTKLAAIGVRDAAMSLDAQVNTHPVVQHIDKVEQASQVFDVIAYQKGESVIRMLEAYVGEDAWRAGVRRYMRTHAYGNTTTGDLWQAMELASGKQIKAIAGDFTLQKGVPMIKLDSAVCHDGKTRIELVQGEYSKDAPERPSLRWRVPVMAQVLGQPRSERTVVTGGKASMELPGCGPVLINAGQSGYFRSAYPQANFDAMAARYTELAAIDQLGILSDTFALGMGGYQSPTRVLDLIQATAANADPQIWGEVAGILAGIDYLYPDKHPGRAAFRRLAFARLVPVLQAMGWTPRAGELDTVGNLRLQLIGTLGRMGEPGVIAEAQRRYQARDSDPAALPGALRKTIMALVANNADAATWDQLHAQALAEKNELKRDHLYTLLAASIDPTLAQRALDLALTSEPGATNSAAMIGTVATRHPEMAFDFALAHRDVVDTKIDANGRNLYYARLVGGSFDPAMPAKLDAYAKAHLTAGSRRAVDTAIADIQVRIKRRETVLPAVVSWVSGQAAH